MRLCIRLGIHPTNKQDCPLLYVKCITTLVLYIKKKTTTIILGVKNTVRGCYTLAEAILFLVTIISSSDYRQQLTCFLLKLFKGTVLNQSKGEFTLQNSSKHLIYINFSSCEMLFHWTLML